MNYLPVLRRSRSPLLYVSIQLGPSESDLGQGVVGGLDTRSTFTSFVEFQHQVSALNALQQYCLELSSEQQREPVDGFFLVRTKLASPWVTVIGEIAKNSAPIGYGFGAILGLHKLLEMLMTWQNHRQALAERRIGADVERAVAEQAELLEEMKRRYLAMSDEYRLGPQGRDLRNRILATQRASQADGPSADEAGSDNSAEIVPADKRDVADGEQALDNLAGQMLPDGSKMGPRVLAAFEKAKDAVVELDRILVAELITPDDPRVIEG